MTSINNIRRHARLGTALAALAISLGTSPSLPAPALAQPRRHASAVGDAEPVGRQGQLVRLSAPMPTCSSPTTRSPTSRCAPRQLYVFGKGRGETTVYRDRAERPGRLCRQRPRQPEHRLGRRDAAPGDAGSDIQATPMNNLAC
jgi:hypothetical protein